MSNLLTETDAKALQLFEELADTLDADRDELAKKVVGPRLDPKRFYRGTLRNTVWRRYDGICFHCGTWIALDGDWHADHLMPWILGGRTTLENGVVACPSCNTSKGDRVW